MGVATGVVAEAVALVEVDVVVVVVAVVVLVVVGAVVDGAVVDALVDVPAVVPSATVDVLLPLAIVVAFCALPVRVRTSKRGRTRRASRPKFPNRQRTPRNGQWSCHRKRAHKTCTLRRQHKALPSAHLTSASANHNPSRDASIVELLFGLEIFDQRFLHDTQALCQTR